MLIPQTEQRCLVFSLWGCRSLGVHTSD